MSIVKDLINKSLGILNLRIKIEKQFFDIPPILKIIRAAAATAVQGILSQLKKQISSILSSLSATQIVELGLQALINELSDDNIRDYIKKNNDIRNINKHLINTSNDIVAPEITLACEDDDYFNKKIAKIEGILSNVPLDGNDYLRTIEGQSDFDEKTKFKSRFSGLDDLYNKALTVLPIILLIYELFLRIRDFITNNRYPSKFRAGYLQGQIRQLGILIKNAQIGLSSSLKEDVSSILPAFRTIDAVITGLMLGTILYLKNRDTGQKKSEESLHEISLSSNCSDFDSTIDVSVIDNPLSDPLGNFSCPLPDINIVPHRPIEEKLKSLECPIDAEDEDIEVSGDVYNSIATKAIIENLSEIEKFNISVKIDQKIESNTVIGQIGETVIYSSVTGSVDKIDISRVWIRDISDIGQTVLEETTNEIKDLYDELNNSRLFIKDFYLDSWLPPMLASTPFVDPSLNTPAVVRTGGINKEWESIKKIGKNTVDNFESKIEKIAGEENVKIRAENNQLNVIKDEYESAGKILYKNLNLYANRGITVAKNTKIKEGDLTYSDYLIDLLEMLATYNDQNNIVVSYTAQLNIFLLERFFIEQFNLDDIKIKINDYCQTLNQGNFLFSDPEYYEILTEKYEQGSDKQSEIKFYVENLGNSNKELSGLEKENIVKKTILLFNFTRGVLEKQDIRKGQVPTENIVEVAFNEGNYIKNYFNNLLKRINGIPDEISTLEDKLEDFRESFVPPSIRTIDEEQYEWYGVKGPERTCPLPEEDNPYLSPYTAFNQGDIEYWLKYCGFATLASVANPLTGWSTGFPPPIGPILFPVVYIPFKSFMTKWGFIVVGLTITGIYPFPWVLFGNLDSNYNTPLGNPTALIKNKISEEKKRLTTELKNFRQNMLLGYLDRTRSQVEAANEKVDNISDIKINHKSQKPVRDRSKNSLADRQSYVKSFIVWQKINVELTEALATAKSNRFIIESKYKLVQDVYDGVGSIENDETDQSLKSIENQAAKLDLAFAQFDILLDQINKILIPLPISMKPNSSNFGITAKNPRPIIKIKQNRDQLVNNGAVAKIIDQFSLKADSFMNSKFGSIADKSILNYDAYKQTLSASMFTLMDEDPFPKYENLQLTNLAWLPFLYKNFVVKGAQTYGLPGQIPLPIG